MPLTLRVKRGHRVIMNGAVLQNSSGRAITLSVLNRATVLLEEDLMLPAEAETPLKRLYLCAQMIYLEPEQHDEFYKLFMELSGSEYADALQRGDSELSEIIQSAVKAIGARNFPGAMHRLQKAIGKPGKERLSKVLDEKE
jgi:flagellar protein FlbT